MSDGREATPFAALRRWERKNSSGRGGSERKKEQEDKRKYMRSQSRAAGEGGEGSWEEGVPKPSPFLDFSEEEREDNSKAGGTAKMQVVAPQASFKLRPGGAGVRRFHSGHRLAGSKINNIVKVKYVRPNADATRHIIQHVDYIQKRERDEDEPERSFFGRDGERSREDVIDSVMKNRGDKAAMFKIILSPKQNELNQIEYASEIMRRFEERSGITTDWSMVEHKNTAYHHVHIVMPGKDMSGYSYRLEQDHLDLLREIANEYQYEIQRLDYEYERQVQQEFGYTRDEANMILLSARDRREMRELGIYRPEVDEIVKQDLLKESTFDSVDFARQIQKEEMAEQGIGDMEREDEPAEISSEAELLYAIASGAETASELSDGEFQADEDTEHGADPAQSEEAFDLSAEAQSLFESHESIGAESSETDVVQPQIEEGGQTKFLDNFGSSDEIDKDDSDRDF